MNAKLFGITIVMVASFLSRSRATRAAGPDTTTSTTATAKPGTAEIPATQPTSGTTEKAAIAPDQAWNFHFQNTDVVQGYPSFSAKYSGRNSLPRSGEIRETVAVDAMAGLRLWNGAEAHVDGLMWQGFGIGDTLGAEGFPSGEAYRIGTSDPNGTIARLFIRQTIGFGGDQEDVPDDQFTLAGKQDVSRITLTLGRMAASDVFDKNAYANDPTRQFMNWAFINNMGWDYPADTIGYITGLTVELNQPTWTLRYGLFETPGLQNGMDAEDAFVTWPYDISKEGPAFDGAFGMVVEYERRYSIDAHPGAVRLLAYANKANMASYARAIPILEANGVGANISGAKTYRIKYGFGLNADQEVANNVGMFTRLGWNDGQEQSWMFNDVDYTASLGVSIKGDGWHRPGDTFGFAGAVNGISNAERDFFAAGGLGILAGDGTLHYGWEKLLETYYDFQICNNAHVSLDYQFIDDPAFNRDRGPVSVFAVRIHWQF